MPVNVRILGLGALLARLNQEPQRKAAAVARGLNTVGREVFAESQREVPVDTGNLRSSGRIDPADAQRLRVDLTYGGSAAGYALVVHETHPTKSKFLEQPAREAATRLRDAIRAEIERDRS